MTTTELSPELQQLITAIGSVDPSRLPMDVDEAYSAFVATLPKPPEPIRVLVTRISDYIGDRDHESLPDGWNVIFGVKHSIIIADEIWECELTPIRRVDQS